jgi:tRNA nucleotidyltransferase (CCA-adding enzyme)
MPFPLFDEYAKLFAQAGVDLFMVGGTSRDYLLGKEIRDVDFVSASTPEETLKILGEGNDRFAKYGTITLKKGDITIDFMTFREEGGYTDSRHPTQIRFITDMERDSYRRDFTINAIYIGRDYQIHDFHGGMADLEAGLIRFIGDPHTRIKEDPLRILRARRFASRLGFTIESESLRAMEELKDQLSLLSPDKVLMESKKV